MQQCNVVYAQGPVQSEPPEPPDSGLLGGTGPDICGGGIAGGGSSFGGGGSSLGGGLFAGGGGSSLGGGLFAGGGVGFCLTFIFVGLPGTIFAPAGGSVATT